MSRRKKKTPESSRTHTLIIQDRSGSMSSRTEATISGYNEFIDELKRTAEGEVLVTLVQFDSKVNTRYAELALSDVPVLDTSTYQIGGTTSLFDAVAKGIQTVAPKVRKGDRVNVTIMTDGGENSSVEFTTKESIQDFMEKKRKEDWTFNFLGAGEASWSGARDLGITYDNQILYGGAAHDHKAAFAAVAASNTATTRGLASSYTASSLDLKVQLEDKAQRKEADAEALRAAQRAISKTYS